MSRVSSRCAKIGIHFSDLDLSVNLSISTNRCFLTEFSKNQGLILVIRSSIINSYLSLINLYEDHSLAASYSSVSREIRDARSSFPLTTSSSLRSRSLWGGNEHTGDRQYRNCPVPAVHDDNQVQTDATGRGIIIPVAHKHSIGSSQFWGRELLALPIAYHDKGPSVIDNTGNIRCPTSSVTGESHDQNQF
jgi:hypothetical protein